MHRYTVELDSETAGLLRAWCLRTGLEPEPALADLLRVLLELVDEAAEKQSVLHVAAQLWSLLDALGLSKQAQRDQASALRRQAPEGG
jgi:hypothetical protein